jgi:ATP-dependent protease HslVU (ClpYQ) peptidase subunit
MTCIAGAIDKDSTVWIGADSVSLQNQDCVRRDSRSKVFTVGSFLVGCTGTHRVCQIVEYLFQPPRLETNDYSAYMVRQFVTGLRAAMKEHGGEYKDSNGTDVMDGRCLVGFAGQLFEIDIGYGVFNPRDGYHAIGCAAQEAMSAMFTSRSLSEGVSAEEMVRCGLEAAAEFDSNIRPPFVILKT